MDAFMFQLLPDLAFRDVVQGMEPMDIFHVTQTSQKTRCLMSRNARLPITVDVSCRFGQYVWFEFCGSYHQAIVFEVNPRFNGPHSRLYKFGKDKKDWSETFYSDDLRQGFETHWNNKLEGYKTIINFLADTFLVKAVSFSGSDEDSFNLLNHIVDRKLAIQKLVWDSGVSTEAVVDRALEIAAAAKVFDFSTPREKQIQITRFPHYSLDSIRFNRAHWITREMLYALSTCLRVDVSGTHLTGKDLNDFLKHFIRNTVRAKNWKVSSLTKFDMETVFGGIKYEEIQKEHTIRTNRKDYIIERHDGVKMNVKYIPPSGGMAPRGTELCYTLKLKVID